MPWQVFQYRGTGDRRPIEDWYDSLHVEEEAEFILKIKMLRQNGPDEFKSTWCGSIRDGIWKLKIKKRRQWRLMLCKGPTDKNRELTFLYEAIEKGGKLKPKDAVDRAIERRREVEENIWERRVPWTRS